MTQQKITIKNDTIIVLTKKDKAGKLQLLNSSKITTTKPQ